MIVTHTNPDFDAITSVWLLVRYGDFEPKPEVNFVNTGNPDQALLDSALAVVDTGKVFDPANLRFDHHQFPGGGANVICAAVQVYEYLISQGKEIEYLCPLVDLVFAGDTGRAEANHSRELGLHAILGAERSMYKDKHGKFMPDQEVLSAGFDLLDLLAYRLKKQAEAHAELEAKTVYKSADGLVWGIKHGSFGSSMAAQEEGAVLVVFEGEPIEGDDGEIVSYPIGVWRQGQEVTEPHTGKLVETVLADDNLHPAGLKNELARWFRHNAGFFSGRGTAKAPNPTPVEVDLETVAAAIDLAWQR